MANYWFCIAQNKTSYSLGCWKNIINIKKKPFKVHGSQEIERNSTQSVVFLMLKNETANCVVKCMFVVRALVQERKKIQLDTGKKN